MCISIGLVILVTLFDVGFYRDFALWQWCNLIPGISFDLLRDNLAVSYRKLRIFSTVCFKTRLKM